MGLRLSATSSPNTDSPSPSPRTYYLHCSKHLTSLLRLAYVFFTVPVRVCGITGCPPGQNSNVTNLSLPEVILAWHEKASLRCDAEMRRHAQVVFLCLFRSLYALLSLFVSGRTVCPDLDLRGIPRYRDYAIIDQFREREPRRSGSPRLQARPTSSGQHAAVLPAYVDQKWTRAMGFRKEGTPFPE